MRMEARYTSNWDIIRYMSTSNSGIWQIASKILTCKRSEKDKLLNERQASLPTDHYKWGNKDFCLRYLKGQGKLSKERFLTEILTVARKTSDCDIILTGIEDNINFYLRNK